MIQHQKIEKLKIKITIKKVLLKIGKISQINKMI